MKRIKALNRYQKALLLITILMAIVFTFLYIKSSTRKGFAYKNKILVPLEEAGKTIYAGLIHGKDAKFSVTADHEVSFQYGEKRYGPYQVTKDPTAVPKDSFAADSLTGVEVAEDGDIIFRGGVMDDGERYWLIDEAGEIQNYSIVVESNNGVMTDSEGHVIDPMEPSPLTILSLALGPKLSQKGNWAFWGAAIVVCLLTIVALLFMDELFRFQLFFKIRNVAEAEPSDWEIIGRYIAWTVLPVLAFCLFMTGLQ